MTNTKFTPGPWRICEQTRIEADSFGLIANLRGEVSSHYETETEANARLIAAAPTMASQIQGAIDCLSQHKVFPADIEQARRLLTDALDTAGIDVLPLDRVATPNATGEAA